MSLRLEGSDRRNALNSGGKSARPHFLADDCPDLFKGHGQKSSFEESAILRQGRAIHPLLALRTRKPPPPPLAQMGRGMDI